MDNRPTPPDEFEGREVSAPSIDGAAMSLITRGEIDMQIATAHKYPRSLKRFRDDVLQMVTLDESIARECYYVLLRKQWDPDKRKQVDVTIEGPSARFAEVVASAWGNVRAGARIVSDTGGFITAQGVCHDLERNVAIAFEVQRSIQKKDGGRFSQDMIATTGNAASSIALRNSILKVVPKAFWSSMYAAAKKCAMGDFKTLANRRKDALAEFQAFGVRPEAVFAKLGVQGIEDVGLNHLLLLHGILTALKDGDTTPEQAFAPDEGPAEPRGEAVAPRKTAAPTPPPPPAAPPPPAETTVGEHVREVFPEGHPVRQAMTGEPGPLGDDPPFDLDGGSQQKQDPLPMPKARELKESAPRNGTRMASVGDRRLLLAKIARSHGSVSEALSLLEPVPEDVDTETLENLTLADYKQLKDMLP